MAVIAIASSGALAGTATIRILDDCHEKYIKEIGSYKSGPGKTFLVVGLSIEFAGSSHDSFFVDASVFNATVDGINYPYSMATFSLDPLGYSPLSTVMLSSGNKTRGYLAFEVPEGTAAYKIEYVGGEGDIIFLPC